MITSKGTRLMPGTIDNDIRSVRIAWWALLALVLAAVVAARVHLLNVPLERDEGEYAYAGQLMLEGIPPYKLAYNMKFPGTYAAYAVVMWLFGQTIAGIHVGLFLINFATIFFVFLIGKQLLGTVCGIASASAYASLSVSPSVLGFAAHATHFVMLPVVAGVYLLLRFLDRQGIKIALVAGVLFGVALLMKQSAIFFVLFAGIYLVLRDWREQATWKRVIFRAAGFWLGAILPLVITCALLWHAGVFGAFWFWTTKYAREYVGLLSLSDGLKVFRAAAPYVVGPNWPLWLLAPIGLTLCIWNGRTRWNALAFFCPFLLLSALAVCPGCYFREHYFIQMLPAISLLAGAAVALVSFAARSTPVRGVILSVFAAAVGFALWRQGEFLFQLSPIAASRVAYGVLPFPEAIRVAEFLQKRSNPGDSIVVLGSEPEIYFYSHRHSGTGYIYTYGLMEPQPYAAEMQREMIREIEAARPKYFVFVGFGQSWMRRTDSETTIFDWFNRYAASNLTGVGLVNVISAERTDYYLPYNWEPVQLAQDYILIYERKL
jgi:4-amino-4-deoxy-L-arabinose transferase-like glycosyltransferase